MEAPNPPRRRGALAESGKSRRAGKLETELIGLSSPATPPSAPNWNLSSVITSFESFVSSTVDRPEARIEHSHRRAVAERKGEQGSRKE